MRKQATSQLPRVNDIQKQARVIFSPTVAVIFGNRRMNEQMILIDSNIIHHQIEELLCFATSQEKAEMDYYSYLFNPNRALYGKIIENDIVGCIGIEFISLN